MGLKTKKEFGLLRVPAGLAVRVLARHGITAPGSLATLYAGARALDGAFFLVSPGPDRRLQPPTPPLRLLRPRAAARCRSPSAATLSRSNGVQNFVDSSSD
uniref:Uncharacterized protein n=1 Tax=Oryza nivara TaxID=4536 RepID=A0A0E0HXA4_ORYNI